jgi:transmembrane sensor
MPEIEFHIADLITGYLRGSLDTAAQAELDAWINASDRNKAFFEACQNEGLLREDFIHYHAADLDLTWEMVLRKLYAKSVAVQPVMVRMTAFKRYASIAAVLLVALSIGLYLFVSSRQLERSQELAFSKIKPGGNKAYLVLSDGKRIALNEAANGTLANETGVEIRKDSGGKLIYVVKDKLGVKGQFNTMETPCGGQYELILPDGTKVWLNAASRLVYPVSFSGADVRRVELTGEGYFEVAKDKKHPFKVISAGQEVEVLGTHFDINSYADEPVVRTTLLEGSVRVNGNTVLKPGEQSVLLNGRLNVQSVNTDNVMDWKNGEFVFDNESLPSILRKVSRWYNVEVEFVNQDARAITFTGSVSRVENVSGVLKALQRTSKLRFIIEGNVIKVK